MKSHEYLLFWIGDFNEKNVMNDYHAFKSTSGGSGGGSGISGGGAGYITVFMIHNLLFLLGQCGS